MATQRHNTTRPRIPSSGDLLCRSGESVEFIVDLASRKIVGSSAAADPLLKGAPPGATGMLEELLTDSRSRQRWHSFLQKVSSLGVAETGTLEFASATGGENLRFRGWGYVVEDERSSRPHLFVRLETLISRRTQEEWRDRQGQIAGALRNAPFPVAIYAEDGEVLQISDSWTRVTGYTLEDIPTLSHWFRKAYGIKAREMEKLIAEQFRMGDQGLIMEKELTIRTKAGLNRTLVFGSSPMGTAADGRKLRIASAWDITPRIQAEEQLRESRERLVAALEASNIGTFRWDVVSGEVKWDEPLKRLFGYPPDAAVDTFGKVVERIHGGDAETMLERARALSVNGTFSGLRFRVVLPDGSHRWLEASGRTYYDGQGKALYVTGACEDVTERSFAEERLRESERMLRELADTTPHIVWAAGADGRLEYFNRRWYEFVGAAGERGPSLKDVVHPEDIRVCLAAWRHSIRTGAPFRVECRLRDRRSGEYRWYLGRAVPFRNQRGQVVRWFGTATDIDSLKRSQEHLKEVDRQKDEFLATVSHELRTPLNITQGYAQLLEMLEPGSAEFQDAIRKIQGSVQDQTRMISDLLDVSRIMAGKIKLDINRFPLNRVVCDAIETSSFAARAKGIEVITELQADLGEITGDPGRVRQIVWNLLSNAVKFTPRGGRITVRTACRDEEVEILVSDTGRGVKQTALNRMFDRFWQEGAETEERHGGLGLGLPIVRHLAEMHGGTVRAESPGPGRGTTVIVRLPVSPSFPILEAPPRLSSPRSFEPGAIRAGAVSPKALAGIRILCVDDHPEACLMLQRALRRYGARVMAARSGPEAVKLLEGYAPDIILCDLAMPGMDGYEFVSQLRVRQEKGGGSPLPVVAVSAHTSAREVDRCLAAGFRAHLAKPTPLPDLVAMISRVLEDERKEAGREAGHR